MKRIANLRAKTPALQRGLQVNIEMAGDRAAFYRVLEEGGTHQIVLVLLNKGATPAEFKVRELLQVGAWKSALDGKGVDVVPGGTLDATVAPHDVAGHRHPRPDAGPRHVGAVPRVESARGALRPRL